MTPPHGDPDAGVIGNERLIALAGTVLLILVVAEIVTVPALRSMLWAHFVIGVLMGGPLAVKTAATGWRFVRYYNHSPAYRRKGPPRPLPRIVAPILLASTLTLLISGIALAITGPAPLILLATHKLSFLVWLLCLTIHVVTYLSRLPRLVSADWRRTPTSPVPGRRSRLSANIAALIAGAIAALLILPTATAWTPWLSGSW